MTIIDAVSPEASEIKVVQLRLIAGQGTSKLSSGLGKILPENWQYSTSMVSTQH